MPTVRELVAGARARLAACGLPGREAGLLLARILGWDEGSILARDEFPVPTGLAEQFAGWLERRLAGEPVAYLLGEREFYGRPFAVDPRVLIPRPETEHLIEAVLALSLPDDARVLDVGVGSGAIAATLALERPDWRVFASDLSLAALAVARTNCRALGGRVGLAGGDLTAPWRLADFDLVVSNPPYVALEGVDIPAELRHEPALALFAPDHPAGPAVALYARLLAELGGEVGVRPGTPVVCEIGWNQEGAVSELAEAAGFVVRRTVKDYAGWPRTMVFLRR